MKLYNSRKITTIMSEHGKATIRRSLYNISFSVTGLFRLNIFNAEYANCTISDTIAIGFIIILILKKRR